MLGGWAVRLGACKFQWLRKEVKSWLGQDEGMDEHSRKGIMAIKPLSPGVPIHLGMMIAFSGCELTCSGCVSRRMTFERSRLRYERSYEGERVSTTTQGRRGNQSGSAIEEGSYLDDFTVY